MFISDNMIKRKTENDLNKTSKRINYFGRKCDKIISKAFINVSIK